MRNLWKKIFVLMIAAVPAAILTAAWWYDANRVDVIAVIRTEKPGLESYESVKGLARFPVVESRGHRINGYATYLSYKENNITYQKATFSVKKDYLSEFEAKVAEMGGELQFGTRL